MKKISYAVLMGAFLFPFGTYAQSSGFADVQESDSYEIIKLQNEIAGLSKKRSALESSIRNIEETYGENKTKVSNNTSKEQIKPVAEVSSAPVPANTRRNTSSERPAIKKPVVAEEVTLPPAPVKRYNPQKNLKNDGNTRGRRPFIRSEISNGHEIYYAGLRSSDRLGYGDSGTVYSGFNDKNVFVFPDALANYCSLNADDAAKDGKMENCLKEVLSDLAVPDQDAKNVTKAMFNDGLVQEVTQAVVTGVQNKNVAANFEADVLDALKTQSSKATDERSDLEVMSLTDMEALKAKYRIIEVYSSMLKFQALKNFNDFEVNSQEITNINEEKSE